MMGVPTLSKASGILVYNPPKASCPTQVITEARYANPIPKELEGSAHH